MTARFFSVRRAVCASAAVMTCGMASLTVAAHAQQAPTAQTPTTAATAPDATPKRFTFKTASQAMSARYLLSLLLGQAGVSYIIGPEVTGELSVNFTDLTLDAALDHIAQSFRPALSITRLQDGTYIIRGGDKEPTKLALSTPPATVTVRQEPPATPTTPPISVSVVGGDPVTVALELQIISLRVERETGAKVAYGPESIELHTLDAKIVALEKQLAFHKANAAAPKSVKTAQVVTPPQPK